MNKKAFTLVELIIVVSIIAVLASLAFMSLSGETAQARDSKRVSDLKVFEDAIATANSKNKKISYKMTDELPYTGISTSTGKVFPLRGATLMKIDETLLDSDVLPTVPRDPKGSPYFGAFLSPNDYQLFGTKENPDTKSPTAVVRGTFKTGAIIDVLTKDIDSSSIVIYVSNANRFVKGDIIQIDNEYMKVDIFNASAKTVSINRGQTFNSISSTPTAHYKSAKIKLVSAAAPNGYASNGLLCMGEIYSAATTPVKITDAATYNNAISSGVGVFCKSDATSGIITDDGVLLPYNVTAN
ncbi:MAG TPA: type II secretion system protein [Candidatus Gracilibacteria bacterium]|nr:type II secretion system protein [Candidatus Gracilibacteria bacterium]